MIYHILVNTSTTIKFINLGYMYALPKLVTGIFNRTHNASITGTTEPEIKLLLMVTIYYNIEIYYNQHSNKY